MTEPRPCICLVEDDPIMGEALAERLDLEGFQVRWHRTGLAALADLTGGAIAVIDIHLPDCSGMALFERIGRAAGLAPPCIFITGCGNIEDAVRLLKRGAADYLTKPLDPTALVDKLRILVREAAESRPLEAGGTAPCPSPRRRLEASGVEAPLGISPAHAAGGGAARPLCLPPGHPSAHQRGVRGGQGVGRTTPARPAMPERALGGGQLRRLAGVPDRGRVVRAMPWQPPRRSWASAARPCGRK
jgi:CheY-like chemotaxis protein